MESFNFQVGIVLLTLSFCKLLVNHSAAGEGVDVITTIGEIRGIRDTVKHGDIQYGYLAFLGIPFAEPPTGNRRFAKPVKKGSFSSIFFANRTDAISCPTTHLRTYPRFSSVPFISEDCLLLNVFTPSDIDHTKPRPVMIYIHGGSFRVGSQNTFKSPLFSARNDVILVTLNYRLGVLGFLANRQTELNGNYGLWDQHMAIQWVHDNIAAFGGDPYQVTLFGNSAGSASVLYHSLYPGNKGLFKNVIAQSGSPVASWGYEADPDSKFYELAKTVNCKGSIHETIACLRRVPMVRIVNPWIQFNPTEDGDFLKRLPNQWFRSENMILQLPSLKHFADINVILGINSNDGALIVDTESKVDYTMDIAMFKHRVQTYITDNNEHVMNLVVHEYIDWKDETNRTKISQSYLNIMKDTTFTVAIIETAFAHAQLNGTGKTYLYEFDHRPSFSRQTPWIQGANHADELPFVFGFPQSIMRDFYGIGISQSIRWDFVGVNGFDLSEIVTPAEFKLSNTVMKYWVQFANTGDPNIPGDKEIHTWPEFDTENQKYIVLQTNMTFPVKHHYRADEVHFWKELVPMMRKLTCNKGIIPLPHVLIIMCMPMLLLQSCT